MLCKKHGKKSISMKKVNYNSPIRGFKSDPWLFFNFIRQTFALNNNIRDQRQENIENIRLMFRKLYLQQSMLIKHSKIWKNVKKVEIIFLIGNFSFKVWQTFYYDFFPLKLHCIKTSDWPSKYCWTFIRCNVWYNKKKVTQRVNFVLNKLMVCLPLSL